MATTNIPMAQTEFSTRIKAYRNALTLVISDGPLILAKADTMVDGSDYTLLETQAGLETEVGYGAALYSNIQTVVLALQANPADPNATAGNAALLATKLRQFVSQVG